MPLDGQMEQIFLFISFVLVPSYNVSPLKAGAVFVTACLSPSPSARRNQCSHTRCSVHKGVSMAVFLSVMQLSGLFRERQVHTQVTSQAARPRRPQEPDSQERQRCTAAQQAGRVSFLCLLIRQ